MILLLPDGTSEDEIKRLLRDAADSARPEIAVALGTPSQAVAAARDKYGGSPLAYLASSEAAALEAIGAGVDEAMHLTSLDASGLLLLLDRAAQRAALRHAGENERTSAVHSEKLAALGAVVAGVAHEVNNPLTGMLLSTQLLRSLMQPLAEGCFALQRLAAEGRGLTAGELAYLASRFPSTELVREGDQITEELLVLTQSTADIVRDLRIFARSDERERAQIVNVVDLIEQVLRIVGREITSHGHIERDFGEAVPELLVSRSRLVQVLTNILINAAHAIREIERPVHRVRITVRSDAEAVAVSISDTGPGIAPHVVERIFDPFYTSKRAGVGTGLGLSISRSILRRLGGDLVVESLHGEGATFIALIPLPDPGELTKARLGATVVPAASRSASRRCVLFVDDDDRLRRIYPRILRDHYDVLVAADGQEAIDLIQSGSKVDVVITDAAMPVMDGSELVTWLGKERPELVQRTVVVTAVDSANSEFFARLSIPVLTKPVSREDLVGAIEWVMGD